MTVVKARKVNPGRIRTTNDTPTGCELIRSVVGTTFHIVAPRSLSPAYCVKIVVLSDRSFGYVTTTQVDQTTRQVCLSSDVCIHVHDTSYMLTRVPPSSLEATRLSALCQVAGASAC